MTTGDKINVEIRATVLGSELMPLETWGTKTCAKAKSKLTETPEIYTQND